MRLSTKSALIVSVLLLGGVCGTYIFLFGSMRAFSRDTSAAHNKLASEATRQAELSSMRRQISETSVGRQVLQSAVLPSGQTVEIINEIESLGRSVGVTVVTDSLTTEGNPKDIGVGTPTEFLTMELTASGSFDTNARFLEVLQSLPYRLVFKNISFDQVDPVHNSTTWKGHYLISIVMYK